MTISMARKAGMKTVLASVLMMFAVLSCRNNAPSAGRHSGTASVTYTVPFYQPSLEWMEYVITYTASDGSDVTETISKDSITHSDGKTVIYAMGKGHWTRQDTGIAFWVRNECFATLPDSCSIAVRVRCRRHIAPSGRIDMVMPQPVMTAVVRYSDGSRHSIVGRGLCRTVVALDRQAVLSEGFCQSEYSSTCRFHPTVSIISGRH